MLNYVLTSREILAPSFLFNISFLLSTFWALFNVKRWSLDLHINTFLVILTAVITFSFISVLINNMYKVLNKRKNIAIPLQEGQHIKSWKIFFLCSVEIITILLTIKFIKNVSPAGNLSDAIYQYRTQVVDQVSNIQGVPRVISLLRNFTDSCGIFFSFVLARGLVLHKKIDYNALFVFVLSIISGLLLGSRGGLVASIIFFVVSIYFLSRKKNQWRVKGNFKFFLISAIGVMIFISLFQVVAIILGRTANNYSLNEYLSIYIGAEIKNLDIFLQNNLIPLGNENFGGQTFISLYKSFGHQTYLLDLPFLNVNGHNLGNVYTTVYPYLYDFGYIGVPVLISLMAIISQIVFEMAKRFRDSGKVAISVLIYGRIVSCLSLAFFSNKFYENIFSTGFVIQVVIWILLDFFLFGNKIKFVWRK